MIAEVLMRWGFGIKRVRALKAYAAALQSYRQAVTRRDSRRVHLARQRLSEAMSARLRIGA